jgi:2-keto-4-pentenoate hydratase/2-oxohepta-3-ene-1,7-dioic acid hydratase in catechol pathway
LRPRGSRQLDWEVELGVVIGRTARYVSRDAALDYVWGYTIVNDVSARDFQFITSQWMAGKIFETAAPVGPYIADRQEIADPHSLGLRTIVNGKQMQNGNTKTFIFDVRYLVSYLSGLMTLSPGDLIATGTPPGIGFAMKPNPVFLQPGDTVRVEIDALGSIDNPVKEA